MVFNSFEYILFLTIFFFLYWKISDRINYQNLLILIASYFFYACWDYKFLVLIMFCSFTGYVTGLKIYTTENRIYKQVWLILAILFNIVVLFFFKYYNFFISSLGTVFSFLGFSIKTIEIILPIGISFYTFQVLGYVIDIYYQRIKPTSNIIKFFAFISFFPQLVAGPIERALNLLPQFSKKRKFSYTDAKDGVRQILWGMFKKVAIADSCASFVDPVFSNYETLNGLILLLAAILFVIQIYCDFSGYSDIAIGSAKLLGIHLMQNFSYPYFSRNMTEFYRKWHISLSTWIRDYVYIPLNIELRGLDKRYRYIVVFLITFTLFGFWHGANWTFVVFGVLQGLAMSYEHRSRKWRKRIRLKWNSKVYTSLSIFFTLCFWFFSCIIFRSKSLSDSFGYISNMIYASTRPIERTLKIFRLEYGELMILSCSILFLFTIEWSHRNKKYPLEAFSEYTIFRKGIYVLISLLIMYNSHYDKSFIYFQF